MPKIIADAREQLIHEAKSQVFSVGYEKTTIRSVAKACGLATGTVYNYFPSKDMLIASFMLEDWKNCLSGMREAFAASETDRARLACIYESLLRFFSEHEPLFSDPSAGKTYFAAAGDRHPCLREQLAGLIVSALPADHDPDPAFTASFITEALLSWSAEKVPFQTVWNVLEKLF